MAVIDFGSIEKHAEALNRTWEEFKCCLINREFTYNDVENAKKATFLKVFHDLFCEHKGFRLIEKRLHDVTGIIGRGTILSTEEDVNYERFIPKEEFIKEDNRFSPKGVEWLYLAIGKDKSILELVKKEIHISIGQRMGYCEFQFDQKYENSKIVDLTVADKYSFKSFNDEFERYGQKKIKSEVKKALEGKRIIGTKDFKKDEEFIKAFTKWIVFTYCKLLSEQIFVPLKSDNRELEYAPFQTIAKYFISLGYEGIIYKSTVFDNGKNIVLFDKNMAYPVGKIIDQIIV